MYRSRTLNTTGTSGVAFITGLALGSLAMIFLPEEHKQRIKSFAQNATNSLDGMLNTDEKVARIKDIFDDNTAKARAIYDETRRSLASTLEDLGEQLEDIDEKKYMSLVNDTVSYIQEHHQLPKKNADKLKKYLQSDFNRLEEII